jgi:hypothetical protein
MRARQPGLNHCKIARDRTFLAHRNAFKRLSNDDDALDRDVCNNNVSSRDVPSLWIS